MRKSILKNSTDGKCTNKKYRFQKPVVAKYQRRIDTLMAALE